VSQGVAPTGLEALIGRLDAAVRLGGVESITGAVKRALESASREPLELPARFLAPRDDCYARRLLHRNQELGYTVVVMTWGPGQRTPLHDHAGMWCVECVVRGQLEVSQFDLERVDGSRYYFSRQKQVHAVVGDAGCLIPPFEYHVLQNALDDDVTITVHVYGGEMDHCHLYRERDDGWEREHCALEYTPN